MFGELPVQYPWAWALAVCVAAALLEGLLSGRGVKRRFAELRFPRGSLPLWAWSIIGIGYYILFFSLLNSLFGSTSTPVWTATAMMLALLLLAANAAWNWVFFRRRDVRTSLAFFVAYVPLALALAFVLYRLANPLFGWFLAYAAYLGYATWWAYGVWRLNRPQMTAWL
jgi:tryptophan-rich sensory protein